MTKCETMTGREQFAGRSAVVTGGANGIGAAIVTALVAQGATVTVADRAADAGAALAEALGERCRFVHCDVTDEQQVRAAIGDGRLDILVNNAGLGSGTDLVELDAAQWRRVLAVNLDGTFFGMKHAAPVMARGGGGAIINLSSLVAGRGLRGMGAYAAAKSGVEALTRTGATELRALGIRVNAIVPGMVRTEAVAVGDSVLTRALGMDTAEFVATRQGRWGTPRDVADVAVHLASDSARFTSGLLYRLDNGA
ncbi:SDR family oxidoreductase [Dietzia aurantiaca]|uniref:SDR family NAD(P)-dependent oxidoreductase n=1 Tax=Dietzia aurantiaca TaxID=983873 RepID=A0ABV9PS81_9ACTN